MKRGSSNGRSNKKRVLIIAYYFPPVGGPGVLRPLKLARYLRLWGWEPTVLSVKRFAYHIYDESNLEEVEFPVYRSDSLDPARLLYLLGRRRSEGGEVNWLRRLLNLPDTRAGWFPFALRTGLILASQVQAIITTAPPFTAHLVGLIIAKKTSLPLITDFRDVWIDFPYLPYYPWQRSIIKILQQIVLKNSSWITVAYDEIIRSFPSRFRSRVTVVYNGYDPDDFTPVEPPEVFTITHMGSITPRRQIRPLVRALKELRIKHFLFRQIGYLHPDEEEELKGMDNVEILGYQDHRKALAHLSGSHLLILLNSPLDSPAPGRQAEYLASRLPIIVLGHGGSTPLIRRLKGEGYPVRFVDYQDHHRLKEVIEDFYRMWRAGRLPHFSGDLGFLTRQEGARVFAEILDRLI
ncbi:hypothetical protein DRP53_09310 [candidate division WOR-3 bacterium]|uniref:Glycosyltransferase subfamily 4-like N-terminal domain-containing protein n=1 Tax=candidate division WOR-3 bacterium TaxID=2052148 RepID=A0A660SGD7_UNCW3|nr:MAG: hypothetical protein DRP53_09310 [candidate division WOR-3 bacterium]